MKKDNYFDNLGNVLTDLKQNLGLEEGLKQREFFKLWSKIVGPKFKNSSKAAYIYERNGEKILAVAVSSSAVTQELSFFKQDIINKIKKVAKDFDYDIKDIYFDPKLWEEITRENPKTYEKEDEPKFYKIKKHFGEKELSEIKLPEEVLEKIKSSLREQTYSSEELKQKMFDTIIKDLKKQEWMKNNGFPLCEKCGIPISNYLSEGKNFCPVCKHL